MVLLLFIFLLNIILLARVRLENADKAVLRFCQLCWFSPQLTERSGKRETDWIILPPPTGSKRVQKKKRTQPTNQSKKTKSQINKFTSQKTELSIRNDDASIINTIKKWKQASGFWPTSWQRPRRLKSRVPNLNLFAFFCESWIERLDFLL